MRIGKLHEIFKSFFPQGAVTTEDDNPYWVVTIKGKDDEIVYVSTRIINRLEEMLLKKCQLVFAVLPEGGIRFIFDPEELR